MASYENILIIKSGALGDLIAGTTAIRAVRSAFPRSRITLLTNRLMNSVCPPGTLCDDAIYPDEGIPSWRSYLRTLLLLRKKHFDLAINLRWASEGAAYATLFSGAKTRAGSGPRGSRWVYNAPAAWHEGRRHEFVRHLDIVDALGVETGTPDPFVYCSDEDRSFARRSLEGMERPSAGVLAIHPGASNPSKAWPAEYVIELGKRFVRGITSNILLLWGPGEEPQARRIVAGIGDGAILAPETSIGRLAALVAACRMCVCNYSGVMNVAMAVKTPLLAIGCTSPEDWGPYGELHRTVSAFTGIDSYTEEERRAAMRSITVDTVWELLSARWQELGSRHTTVAA